MEKENVEYLITAKAASEHSTELVHHVPSILPRMLKQYHGKPARQVYHQIISGLDLPGPHQLRQLSCLRLRRKHRTHPTQKQ